MKSKINILIAVLTLTLVSCFENKIVYDTENLEFRTMEFVAPIAKIHAPLYGTLIKELKDFDGSIEIIEIDGQRLICVKYYETHIIEWSDEIGFRGAERTFEVPVVTAGSGLITGSKSFPVHLYSSDDEEHSYVKVADLIGNGKLEFSVNASNLAGVITLTIHELKNKNGQSFSKQLYLSSGQSYNVSATDLDGYRIATDNNHNLNVIVDISVSGMTPGVSLSKLDVRFILPDMDISYMSGYFGQIDSEETGEMTFDFLEELDFNGTVGFKNILIDAVANNWAGVPIKVTGDFFFDNEAKPIAVEPALDFIVTAAPNEGNMAVNSFTTKIPKKEFVSGNYPSGLLYKVKAKTNPGGNPNNDVTNFIIKKDDDILANVDFTLTVPLDIKVEAYSRKDTIDFDYNKLVGNRDDYVNNVEYMYINLLVDNGLPFDVALEVTAINKSDFRSRITICEIIANKKDQRIKIELTENQLKDFRINEVKYIEIKSISNTNSTNKNEDYVRVYENDYMDIDVSVNIKADLPSNIFE